MPRRETGGLGELLAPVVSDALADLDVGQQVAALTAQTLASPEVDAAVNRLGLRLAAWTAGGIALGIVAGYYLRRGV
jgi:hypothetical protein